MCTRGPCIEPSSQGAEIEEVVAFKYGETSVVWRQLRSEWRKPKEEIYGWSERGHEDSGHWMWLERVGFSV